jgi:hypothetical protein
MYRHFLIPLLGVSMSACSALAQQSPDSVHIRNDCRLATQIVQSGPPAPQTSWAYEKIAHCGPSGGDTLAALIRANRSERDTLTLQSMLWATAVLVDGNVFNAAMDVAADPGASTVARVFAYRTIALAFSPGSYIRYGDITRAPGNVRSCGLLAPAHFRPERGTPLPANARESLDRISRALQDDPTNPEALRHAAGCARGLAGFGRRHGAGLPDAQDVSDSVP